jgi:glycosyltransferase involved in cell wall biosynthesis
MGDLIPARGAVLGAVLPNVLDEAFEAALAASNDAPSLVGDEPCFVSIGSFTTYRGIQHLVAGYAHYRALGGRIPLVIAGPGRAPRIRDDRALDGITVLERSLSRDAVLATFVRATAAIFPSTVETSGSITLLEATATCRRVLASDIPGHVAVPGATRCFANGDPTELGTLLIDAEHTWPNDAPMTPFDRTAIARRAAARHTWCDDLANRLRPVAGVSA